MKKVPEGKIGAKESRTSGIRRYTGLIGGALVKLSEKLRLPADTYYRIHNATLPTPDGTAEIDDVFVSRYGIFVVETNNMKGWIFGEKNQSQWTQQIFKESFKFQNPIQKNKKNINVLRNSLQISPDKIHSVIAFVGESTFKTPMPANVTSGGGYIGYIKSFTTPVLDENQVNGLAAQILSGHLARTQATHCQLVRQFKEHAEATTEP